MCAAIRVPVSAASGSVIVPVEAFAAGQFHDHQPPHSQPETASQSIVRRRAARSVCGHPADMQPRGSSRGGPRTSPETASDLRIYTL